MGIQNWVLELGQWFASLGIGAAALTYLGKKLIDTLSERDLERIRQDLSKALETHKAQLTLQSTTEIERLKSELQIAANRQSVGYASLHAKRGEVIAEAYSTLVRLDEAAVGLLAQLRRRESENFSHQDLAKDLNNYPLTEQEKLLCERMANDYRSFKTFFRSNKIYLPTSVAAQTDHLAFSFYVLSDHYAFNGHWYDFQDPEVFQNIKQSIESMSSRISELLPIVEDEFRSLLSGSA